MPLILLLMYKEITKLVYNKTEGAEREEREGR
jgi:hypothetical protein